MENKELDPLKLENQLCFPIYAAARKIVSAYTPFLKPLGLTYVQYITMMVLWECPKIPMRDLCERLYLDSGTLTLVLKKLERSGYITRARSHHDERVLIICLTEKGRFLREKVKEIPFKLICLVNGKKKVLTLEKMQKLQAQLYDIIAALK